MDIWWWNITIPSNYNILVPSPFTATFQIPPIIQNTPVNSNDAVNKFFVDNAFNTNALWTVQTLPLSKVPKYLVYFSTPPMIINAHVNATDAVNKQYVDTSISTNSLWTYMPTSNWMEPKYCNWKE